MLILLGDWVCLLTPYWCSEFLVEVIVTSRNTKGTLMCLTVGEDKTGSSCLCWEYISPKLSAYRIEMSTMVSLMCKHLSKSNLSPSSASARICYYLTPPSSIFCKICLFSLSSWYQVSSNLQLVKIQMDGWPFLLNWLPLMSHLLYFPKEKC